MFSSSVLEQSNTISKYLRFNNISYERLLSAVNYLTNLENSDKKEYELKALKAYFENRKITAHDLVNAFKTVLELNIN